MSRFFSNSSRFYAGNREAAKRPVTSACLKAPCSEQTRGGSGGRRSISPYTGVMNTEGIRLPRPFLYSVKACMLFTAGSPAIAVDMTALQRYGTSLPRYGTRPSRYGTRPSRYGTRVNEFCLERNNRKILCFQRYHFIFTATNSVLGTSCRRRRNAAENNRVSRTGCAWHIGRATMYGFMRQNRKSNRFF